MMLQGLLIPGVYLSLIRLWLPIDKNSAQYSTRLLTLQWPLTPQGHFKSQKSPYLYTPVYYTGCVYSANKVVCVETCGYKKHQYFQKLNDDRLEAFKMQSYLFCCLAT